eukprot:TRINITY_DN1196_c0_g1_i3.p1 TRINITY_DN1196_c0_g1~~TRINITY_DN1196_c0_g1_i3.p1  ORF type:complete len:142 (+),score=14.72 TRINITY_DN1196_c0_g1_i3:542-967(+)
MLYFGSLVLCLNVFLIIRGTELHSKLAATAFDALKTQIIGMITGTAFLSVVFLGSIIIVVAYGILYTSEGWLVYEIVTRSCLFGASILQAGLTFWLYTTKKLTQSKSISKSKSKTTINSQIVESAGKSSRFPIQRRGIPNK